MSEMIKAKTEATDFRRRLLTSVSALALLACVSTRQAVADDGGQPLVWIELGGTFERMEVSQAPYIPTFASGTLPSFVTIPPAAPQKPPGYGFGGEAALSFQPEGSDWVVSAAARYGRSLNNKKVYQHAPFPSTFGRLYSYFYTGTRNTESHAIVDFRAGKDVGLGMAGTSTINLGVRFAQFNAHSDAKLAFQLRYRSGNYATAHIAHGFHGVGPSISWDGSTPLLGNAPSGQISLDWGANAALLFGRQKTSIYQQTNHFFTHYSKGIFSHTTMTHPRDRAVTVPNAGAFAGVSYRLESAKVKLGYRADFFFGAMDGGFDTAHRTDRSFYGPFLNIAVGIGG